MTRIVCCHAVRALRSTVAKPVPVAALTQRKRESMNLTGNFPLDPQKIAAQKSGTRRLVTVGNGRSGSDVLLNEYFHAYNDRT